MALISEKKMKKFQTIYLHILLIFYCLPVKSQNFELGSWNILNIKYNINQTWSVFGEGQLRSLRFFNHFHYHEYKGGINFKASEALRITIGAGKYDTYKEGGNFLRPKNSDEWRLWPQLIFFQKIVNKISVEHRYRAELRFTDSNYRNRYRYRIGLNYSFGKELNGSSLFNLSVSDEIFLTDIAPFFERNRFMAALNYKVSPTLTLQTGYVHQFDYKINDETGNDFLLLGMFFEIGKSKGTNLNNQSEIGDN